MKLEFHKYQGNGNDFILLDNRTETFSGLSQKNIAALCHRRFGIGADGLILLNSSKDFDFEMKYFNSDGNESTMCGNGGRCMIKFAKELGIIGERTHFLAIDGEHEGVVGKNGIIMLKMNDVSSFRKSADDYIINTGSPHLVKFVESAEVMDVFSEGRKTRNQPEFLKEGINVNFVEMADERIKVRTYERGVEDETLSCGTGVVASALVSTVKLGKKDGRQDVFVETPGGKFEVTFVKKGEDSFSDIWLIGGAKFVFKGEIEV